VSNLSVSHLTNSVLRHELATFFARDRSTTAGLLARLAEFDARKLYLPAGYPSMYAYCVGEFALPEGPAYTRIRVARAARRFPTILEAIEDGRLHLSTVVLLAPHLTEANAAELLRAAERKGKAEVEQLLAARFPRPDMPARIEAIAPVAPLECFRQLMPASVVGIPTESTESRSQSSVPSPVTVATMTLPAAAPSAPTPTVPAPTGDRVRVTPLAPQRHGIQFTVDQATLDLLRDVQALLGHRVRSGDLATVFHRALLVLKRELERQKFAATDEPRPGRPRSADSRHIPAEVKRAVWERDQGRCTYVSETGHRCEERSGVQFDHIDAYARGGAATVTTIRLRCRAHNQYDAERTFGAEFMRQKRLAAAGVGDIASTAARQSSPAPSPARGNRPARTARPAPPAACADRSATWPRSAGTRPPQGSAAAS